MMVYDEWKFDDGNEIIYMGAIIVNFLDQIFIIY